MVMWIHNLLVKIRQVYDVYEDEATVESTAGMKDE